MHTLAQADAELRGLELSNDHHPILVPRQERLLAIIESERREEFFTRLQTLVEENFKKHSDLPDSPPEEDFGELLTASEVTAIGKACAACRGNCCLGGDNHAYLNEQTILRIRAQHPDLQQEQIVDKYTAHIGTESYAGSCLFHGRFGCTLAPELRSAICHSHLCVEVKQMLVQLQMAPHTVGYLASRSLSQIHEIVPLIH